MINSLEYTKGNIEVKIDGHRHVLESAKTLSDGEEIKESDLTNELPIVRAIAQAVFATTEVSEGVVKFSEQTGLVKWNGSEITPETPLAGLPADIRAFAQAVRTPKTIATFESLKPPKEPEYVMEDYTVSGIKIIDGVPTIVNEVKQRPKTKPVRVRNEDRTLAFKRDSLGRRTPLFFDQPILKNGN